MTTNNTKIDTKPELEYSEIGEKFLFWNDCVPDVKMLSFSSLIENIGIKHDCQLKNKIEVIVLSDPTEASHYSEGPILVSKIMAHKIMWVCTNHLKLIND